MKRIGMLATVMACTLGLIACGSSSQTTTTAAPETTKVAETTAQETTKAASKEETTAAETTAAASDQKLSGSVTVYMPSPSGLNEKYIEGFEKKTGVKVELFEGTTGEILARLETEKDNPVADVIVLASWSDGLAYKEANDLYAFTDAENADKLYPDWKDADNKLFGTSASAVGVIYNTTIVPELNADWKDLGVDEYKDLLAIADPISQAQQGGSEDRSS